MYNLTFFEALTKCLDGEGFIRGNRFADGVYVKKRNEELVLVDGNHYHREIGELPLSNGTLEQKYKVFAVVTPEAISNKKRRQG